MQTFANHKKNSRLPTENLMKLNASYFKPATVLFYNKNNEKN